MNDSIMFYVWWMVGMIVASTSGVTVGGIVLGLTALIVSGVLGLCLYWLYKQGLLGQALLYAFVSICLFVIGVLMLIFRGELCG